MTTPTNDGDEAKGIGARLFKARTDAGAGTQAEVAQRLGLGVNTVGIWERGLAVPVATNLAALCRLYGVSADWVLGLSQVPRISGTGGIVNLAVERVVASATGISEVVAECRKLGAMLGDRILFGYTIPNEYEVLSAAEWEPRRQSLRLKLERLQHHDTLRGSGRKSQKPG